MRLSHHSDKILLSRQKTSKMSSFVPRKRNVPVNVKNTEEIVIEKKAPTRNDSDDEIDIEIEDDEEILVKEPSRAKKAPIKEKEPVKQKIGKRAGFKSSNARGSGSSSISLGFEYRPTSRINDITPVGFDYNDLWEVIGKYPRVADLHNILESAIDKEKVDEFNALHGTNYSPASSDFKNKKSRARTMKKEINVAKVLLNPLARRMTFEFLKTVKRGKSNEPIYPKDASLDDDNFFIQFTKNGPVFPGNAPEDEELERASGYVLGGATGGANKGSYVRPEITPRFDADLLQVLKRSTAEDPDKPETTSKERVALVKALLDQVSMLNEQYIEDLIGLAMDM